MKGLKNAGRLLLLGWGVLTAMAMGRTAEVIAFLVGVVLYIVRHRCFNLDVSNE